MEYIELEHKLYHILDAKYYLHYDGQEYTSIPNSISDKNRAGILYNQIIDDIKYDTMITWDEAQAISERLGIWTKKNDESLKTIENLLENLKLQLFLDHTNPSQVKKLKKQTSSVKKGIEKSNENKYSMYAHTKEHYASTIKRDFLIGLSIRDANNERVMLPEDFWLFNNPLIENFFTKMHKENIPVEEVREIARSEPWRSMWLAQKSSVFPNSAYEWTDNQRLLVSFSRMYDNVHESMESPSDDVIKDDDMLDGWFIKQKRDREKKQKEQALDDKFGKFKDQDGQELFIATRPEDVQDVYNMNDAKGKGTIKSRNKQIKEQGEVKHAHLRDVQMDLHMQKTQELRESMRRR